jgi:thiamine-monophosphate kinase
MGRLAETAVNGPTLGDIGERRIIADLLSNRYLRSNPDFGDDVVQVLDVGEASIVATTDPAPMPVVWELGYRDYFDWGWLLAAINLSDLAAAGAQPLGLMTSLTLRPETLVSDFGRLLDGVDACCAAAGTHVLGGNIKESLNPVCEATAIGIVNGEPRLSRRGTVIGDKILALGDTGLFWSALLTLDGADGIRQLDRRLLMDGLVRPKPLIRLGIALRQSGLVHASTDASDGIFGAVASLIAGPRLGFIFEPQKFRYLSVVSDVARRLGVDPFRLALGFGNFELVVSTDAKSLDAIYDLASGLGVHVTELGFVDAGPGIRVSTTDGSLPMTSFDNERFTPDSQFTAGIASYKNRLLESPLAEVSNIRVS